MTPPAALHVSSHFWAYVEEQNAYLGLPLLALLVSIAVRWWAHLVVRWASLLATITVVLSLGAHLMVGGHVLPVALPWHVVEHLPLLENILPGRLMIRPASNAATTAPTITNSTWICGSAREMGEGPTTNVTIVVTPKSKTQVRISSSMLWKINGPTCSCAAALIWRLSECETIASETPHPGFT